MQGEKERDRETEREGRKKYEVLWAVKRRACQVHDCGAVWRLHGQLQTKPIFFLGGGLRGEFPQLLPVVFSGVDCLMRGCAQ